MKVGDYIRYKNCIMKTIFIAKIIEIKAADNVIKEECYLLDNKDAALKKHVIGQPSCNSIDLIQVGDYVNGYKVLEICEGNFEINNPLNVKALKLEFVKEDINPNIPFFKRYNFILNEDIKSIVTKEQFEQMEYKIEIKVN